MQKYDYEGDGGLDHQRFVLIENIQLLAKHFFGVMCKVG